MHLLHCDQQMVGATHRRAALTVHIAVPLWEGHLQVTRIACVLRWGVAEPAGSSELASTAIQ